MQTMFLRSSRLTLPELSVRMAYMNYRQLIAQSWAYTQENKKLIRWLGFFPSIFTTTVGVGYILYQFFALKKSYIFNETDEHFLFDVVNFGWTFVTEHFSWTLPMVIFAVIFAVIYFLFPTLARAAAIQKIARNRNGQKASVGTGLRYGILSFLPLFEYHLIIKTFSFFSILIEMSFVARNLGMVIFKILFPLFLLVLIIGLILTLLFTYTDFYIVIDGTSVFESMKKSARLVIAHWKHTFLITMLMLIIGVRIIIQAVLVFLIPILVVGITGYIATIALPSTSLIIGGIFGGIGLILAAYLNGIVDIFAYTVWTFTFLSLTQERELSARDVVSEDEEENPSPISPVVHKNL